MYDTIKKTVVKELRYEKPEELISLLSDYERDVIYRHEEKRYRTQDFINRAENMHDDDELNDVEYDGVMQAADYLAERFIDKYQNSELGEYYVMTSMIQNFITFGSV